jgi:hypothetical protein
VRRAQCARRSFALDSAARRTAPLVGPSVTERVVEPPVVVYLAPRATVTVEEVGLTTTVPPVKLRRHAEPTWNRAPTGEPTSAVQLALYGSWASGSVAWKISAPPFLGSSWSRKFARAHAIERSSPFGAYVTPRKILPRLFRQCLEPLRNVHSLPVNQPELDEPHFE